MKSASKNSTKKRFKNYRLTNNLTETNSNCITVICLQKCKYEQMPIKNNLIISSDRFIISEKSFQWLNVGARCVHSNIAINLFFLFLLFAWLGCWFWELIMRYFSVISTSLSAEIIVYEKNDQQKAFIFFPEYHGASSSTGRQ